MLFHTLHFAIFFAIILVTYHNLRSLRAQNGLLLAASLYFYGSWDWRFLGLLLLSTVVDYGAGLWIHRQHRAGRRGLARLGLAVSMLTSLAILGFFKYWNFFAWGAARLIESVGLHASWTTLNIVLPVGISFYTFQTMSYTIDVYRGIMAPARSLRDFALFVSFFPQLVAGPIERAVDLLPQVQRARTVTQRDLVEGVTLILIGLVRKVVIADSAGVVSDLSFGDASQRTSLQLLCAMLLYGLQIYGDFAGYSDMARGTARLLGFRLMRNFKHPYFATNIADFWHRWHISLSTWLRDYLYIPLGGSRKGAIRTSANLMVTMLLGGLWHGAHWTFVFWGGLHGSYLLAHRLFKRGTAGPVARFVSWLATFGLVMLTWLPFRINNVGDLRVFVGRMTDRPVWDAATVFPLLLLAGLTLVLDLPQHMADDEYVFLRAPPLARIGMMAAVVLLLVFTLGGATTPFIYFQF